MYSTSDTYKEKIKELDQVWETKVDIEHEKGTLHLTDKDIALGGMSVTEKTQPGEDFTVGGTVASDLSLKILNRTGAGNLLKNSGDFTDLEGWNGYRLDIVTKDGFQVITGEGRGKANSLEGEKIPIESNTTYTYSMVVMFSEDVVQSSTPVHYHWHDTETGQGASTGTKLISDRNIPANTWVKVVLQTTTRNNLPEGSYFKPMIYGLPEGARFWMRNIKLEIGDQATPWEDDYSDIDFTGAKIKPYVMLTEEDDDEGRNLLSDSGKEILMDKISYHKVNHELIMGETYTLSYDYEWLSGTGMESMLLLLDNNTGAYQSVTVDNVVNENRPTGRVSFTFTVTVGNRDGFLIYAGISASESRENTMKINKLKLEKGDMATDWRPAVEDWSEPIPLGIFNVDTQSRFRSTIELKAMDNMIKLDRSYSHSRLSYPATLYQIYVDICTTCNLLPATHNFLHKDLLIKNRPKGDFSCRDILGFVAQLSGSFAKITRDGKVALKWYEPTGLELGPMNRFEFKPSDGEIRITGVMFKESDDKAYLAGTDEYAIDLTENPLLQGNYKTILPAILDKVKDIKFNPYTAKWQGDPAIEAGDMVKHIDVDGNEFNTIITGSTYKYRQAANMEAKAKSKANKGYKGSTSKKLANVVQKIVDNRVEVEDKLTSVEQAQLNAMQLMANMLGGHAIVKDDAFYIADNTNLSKAKKVWKWGMGGFAYYPNGLNNPPSTAITADNSIVAMLVAANIITADMVRTGLIQSEDGSTWINLDNGQYNFADKLIWDGKEFKIDFSGLNIGARNIVLGSKKKKTSNDYHVATYNITEDWEPNTTYTLSIKGNINNGQNFGIWANGPSTRVTTLDYDSVKKLYTSTFTTPSTINGSNFKTLRVYNFPSDGATSATMDWIMLEKGMVATDWTSAEGELTGATYTFDGNNATFKGAGFKIQNKHSEDVLWGNTTGDLSFVGDLTTYNNNQKAVEISRNSMRFYDWEGTTRKNPVGKIYTSRQGSNPTMPGIAIGHDKGGHISLVYEGSNTYYAYMDFDKDKTLTSANDYPIRTREWMLFDKRARFNYGAYFGPINQIFNSTDNTLVCRVNGANHTGFSMDTNKGLPIVSCSGGDKWYISVSRSTLFNTRVHVNKDFSVTGKKNAVHETKNYGKRLINAYETAGYYFGDIGSGKIGEDGLLYIYICDILDETVNTHVNYHITYGKCGKGDVYTKEKHKNYFVVEGTPGLWFSWELKAKRNGYEYDRLEVPGSIEEDEEERAKDEELKKIVEDECDFDLAKYVLGGDVA